MLAPEVEVLFENASAELSSHESLIGVVVTLFNYSTKIINCLESVRAQHYPRLELVVIDDASTDSSATVALDWIGSNASRFEHIVLMRQTKNQGLSVSRNLAIDAATSEFIFILDADNEIYPRALGRLLETIQDTNAAVAYSQLVYFGSASGIGPANIWNTDNFKRDNYIDAMSLIRKSAWREVGGYSPIDYGWEDYDLWCKFIEAGFYGTFVPELLCRYQAHPASMRHVETIPQRTKLVHAMMAAHPWLDLRI